MEVQSVVPVQSDSRLVVRIEKSRVRLYVIEVLGRIGVLLDLRVRFVYHIPSVTFLGRTMDGKEEHPSIGKRPGHADLELPEAAEDGIC